MKKILLLSILVSLFCINTQAQFGSIGIIGSATPDGWSMDTNMIQDAVNPELWYLTIQLGTGDAKFRADDSWSFNWANTDFPIGTGILNGPSIPVTAGNYSITFNSNTGAYSFLETNICLINGIVFNSQSDIDSFPIVYPDCQLIYGNVSISGMGITNLNGLSMITFIGGFLDIHDNPDLTSIAGLSSLTSIGQYLRIDSNNLLPNLNGLNSLTSIDGDLTIAHNPLLTNILDIINLNAIDGTLDIENCDTLVSLTGLNNINPSSITNLIIQSSEDLSICNVKSICDYLSMPSNPATITGNAQGCVTRTQLETYCADFDSDGIIDSLDNCVTIFNRTQEDADNDGVGDVCDFGSENNVGIGNNTPTAKLHVSGGSIYLDNNSGGIILRSPDGSCWIIRVDNNGKINSVKVPCPN